MSAVSEHILTNLEGRFLSFIESVPDAMVLSDTQGKIVLLNTNTEKLFGYRRREILGEKMEVLVPARFHDRHSRHRANYYSNPSIRPMGIGRDVLACRKNGGEFLVEINLSPVRIRGELFVWSAIRNVSEREALFRRVRISLEKAGVYRGQISICGWCKRVREEHGTWQALDQYIALHSAIKFTQSMCEECLQKLDPNPR
jgi:PAS domain S-box-containing protein